MELTLLYRNFIIINTFHSDKKIMRNAVKILNFFYFVLTSSFIKSPGFVQPNNSIFEEAGDHNGKIQVNQNIW